MSIYKEIVKRFPSIAYSFAYGSGVKKQIGYDTQSNGLPAGTIIDFMFCIDNPKEWHTENLKKHPSHYSGLGSFGGNFLASYQTKLGAKVYFNTLVPLPDLGVTIKYGVVSKEHLIEDLQDWKYLYLAGRLHKPVLVVTPPNDTNLTEALDKNLQSAFLTALLLLPAKFDDIDLFHTITSISYKGDFRMIFGENKNKIRNIVDAQKDEFFELYYPVLKKFPDYVALGTDRKGRHFEQDKTVQAIGHHLHKLPITLQKKIAMNSSIKGSLTEVLSKVAERKNLQKNITMSIDDIVWDSSVSQSVKNILTAGMLKSIIYSYRKAAKTFKN